MEPDHVPALYLLCGKIAAGKSTLARRLAARPMTLLISEDHWTSNLFADDRGQIVDRSIWCSPRTSLGRCSRHDLQAEAAGTK
jgi:predicted kinase